MHPVPVLTVSASIKTNARQAKVAVEGGRLRIDVRSPPIDGQANREAIELVARLFGVAKSHVELLRGARSRHKRFRIARPRKLPAGLGDRAPELK
jgi:hypothetical protein